MSEADFGPLRDVDLEGARATGLRPLTEEELREQAAQRMQAETGLPGGVRSGGGGVDGGLDGLSGGAHVGYQSHEKKDDPSLQEPMRSNPFSVETGRKFQKPQKYVETLLKKWEGLDSEEKMRRMQAIVNNLTGALGSPDPEADSEIAFGRATRIAGQIAELIRRDVVPGIEPFTKGVLMLAFSGKLPLRVSLPLTQYFGNMLTERIEGNAERAADFIEEMGMRLDAAGATQNEKELFNRIVDKVKNQTESDSEGDGVNPNTEALNPESRGVDEGATSTEGSGDSAGETPPAEGDGGGPGETPPTPPGGGDGGGEDDGGGDPPAEPDGDPEEEGEEELTNESEVDHLETLKSQEVDYIEIGDSFFAERYNVSEDYERAIREVRRLINSIVVSIPERSRTKDQVNLIALLSEPNQEGIKNYAKKLLEQDYRRHIKEVVIAGRTYQYFEYDVRNTEDCKEFGQGSESIVVKLARSDELSRYSDDEIEVIRSLDPKGRLHSETEPELFLKYFEIVYSEASNPDVPGDLQSKMDAAYTHYRSTLMGIIYTLVADKVAEEDNRSGTPHLASQLGKQISHLKEYTKGLSQAELDRIGGGINVTLRLPTQRVPESELALPFGSDKKVKGMTEVRLPVSKALQVDILGSIDAIDSTVTAANTCRARLHTSVAVDTVIAAGKGISFEKLPGAVGDNPYLAFAMQEYVRSLSQVVAEINHLPQSNFLMLEDGKIERAEMLTMQAMMLRFPPPTPVDLTRDEARAERARRITELFEKSLREKRRYDDSVSATLDPETRVFIEKVARSSYTDEDLQGMTSGQEIIAIDREVMRQNDLDNDRRKKRYETDIETAVKVAKGLQVGLGEFWSVLDSGIGDEMLTSTVKGPDGKPTRAIDFQDVNSTVLANLAAYKFTEEQRFGKEDGFGLIGVETDRYIGEIPQGFDWASAYRSARGWRKLLLKYLIKAERRVPDDPTKASLFSKKLHEWTIVNFPQAVRDFNQLEAAKNGQLDSLTPDTRTHTDYLKNTRDILNAEREGPSKNLERLYENSLTIRQMVRVPVSNLPASGGWRVEGADGFDKRYISGFEKQATEHGLSGLPAQEFVMNKLRELGGERMVIYYIGKKLKAFMKQDPEYIPFMTQYDTVETKLKTAAMNGDFETAALKEDEVWLERALPIMNRMRDQARAKYINQYVMTPLLEKHPEMALLMERKAFAPKMVRAEVEAQLIYDLGRNGASILDSGVMGNSDRLTYAMRYVCIPLFEVAMRSESHIADGKALSREELVAFKKRIFEFFQSSIKDSSPIQVVPGQISQAHPSLSQIFQGDDLQAKTLNMYEVYDSYKRFVGQTVASRRDDIATRLSRDIVLGLGKADAMLTSAAGFDYSSVSFDGLNAFKSATGGIETNIDIKKEMRNIEKKLHELYTTPDLKLKLSTAVDALGPMLDDVVSKLTGNPDEANVHYVRLAQICVFSLRASLPGGRRPSIWDSGLLDRTGSGLDAKDRYRLLKGLMNRRSIPDRLIAPDRTAIDYDPNVNAADRYTELVVLEHGTEDSGDGTSRREKAADRLVAGRTYDRAISRSVTVGMALAGMRTHRIEDEYIKAAKERNEKAKAS